jgi:hypothetical protein
MEISLNKLLTICFLLSVLHHFSQCFNIRRNEENLANMIRHYLDEIKSDPRYSKAKSSSHNSNAGLLIGGDPGEVNRKLENNFHLIKKFFQDPNISNQQFNSDFEKIKQKLIKMRERMPKSGVNTASSSLKIPKSEYRHIFIG